MANDYLGELSEFLAETPGASIPADVRDRAAAIMADCVGCIAAGTEAPEVRALAAYWRDRQSEPMATVAGMPDRLGLEAAALVGGTAGTWHDLDEGNLHTRAHAAIQIVPAVLAEAEARAASGAELIDAFVLAYEVAGRLWRATKARLAVHPHGTFGPLAAAAALARLRGADAAGVRTAMNIAMTLGIASSRQALNDGATVRNIYTGHSGRAGFEALALQEMGFTGERDAPGSILGNLYGETFDPETAVAGLGSVWWMRKSYFKRFASGRYTHAALDAVELLLERPGIDLRADGIARIDVETFFMAATMGQQQVGTPFGMRFSLPAAIASRIVRGIQPLTDDGAAAFADPRVHELASRVFVAESAAATAAYPDRQPAALTVTFRDGRQETANVERILGESDQPLPEGALRDKFLALATPSLGEIGAENAFAAFCSIDSCANVAALLAQLCGAAAAQREKRA